MANTKGTISKEASGKYRFNRNGEFEEFESLQELLEDNWEADVAESDPYLIGYKLGGLAVSISECPIDKAKILEGLADSTDRAWLDAVNELAAILGRFDEATK